MTRPADPIAVAVAVTQALDNLHVPNTIGGSMASSFASEPRSTLDIDIVAALNEQHVAPLVTALAADFYIEGGLLVRAIRTAGSSHLIHQASQLKVDLFIAGGTPLDEQQLRRRMRVEISGCVLHIHPPGDILLQKLRRYQRGGGVSDRQWRDIVGIVRTQGARLDREYLARSAPVLGVTDLLARALAEP